MDLLGGWEGLALAVGLAVVFSIHALRKSDSSRGAASPEARVTISSDESGVRCAYPGGSVQWIPWSEITEIRIRTTSRGPWLEDVWWEVCPGESPPIVYPNGATGVQDVLTALAARLPRFDHRRVGEAMTCASDRVFLIWQREWTGTPSRA